MYVADENTLVPSCLQGQLEFPARAVTGRGISRQLVCVEMGEKDQPSEAGDEISTSASKKTCEGGIMCVDNGDLAVLSHPYERDLMSPWQSTKLPAANGVSFLHLCPVHPFKICLSPFHIILLGGMPISSERKAALAT